MTAPGDNRWVRAGSSLPRTEVENAVEPNLLDTPSRQARSHLEANGGEAGRARAARSLAVTPDSIRGPASSCSFGEDDSGGTDQLRLRKGSGTPDQVRGDGGGLYGKTSAVPSYERVIAALPSAAFDPADPFPGARIIIHDRKFRLLHDDGTIGPVPFKLSRKASFAAAELAAEYQLGKSA